MNLSEVKSKDLPRVLVIDDELGPRESLRYLLGEEFKVDVSDRVEGGLEKISQTTYDTIIMDIRLPSMNGIEGLAKVREIDTEVSIIMLTGYGNLETAQEAIKLGANEYVTKPFDIHKMLDIVRKHTKESHLRRQRGYMLREVQKMNDILKGQLEERESMASWGKASARLVHDLSSPLTAILGYSSLLLHEVKNATDGSTVPLDNALAYAETLERNANYCRELAQSWKEVCKGNNGAEVFSVLDAVNKVKSDIFFNEENIIVDGRWQSDSIRQYFRAIETVPEPDWKCTGCEAQQ
jgi:ActR/RegA family two-component response regulator